MRRSKGLKAAALVLMVLLSGGGMLRAQDEQNADDPTRGVARISVVQGEVNVKRGDSGELVAAAMNAPLMTQDHLQTAEGSRSEIEFDAANLARLAPETDLGLAAVERGRYQLQLGLGTVIYRVLRASRADVEIDTPSISMRPAGVGVYRISVTQDGTTEVTVRAGEASIFSPRGSQQLRAGQTMLARGSNTDPEFQVEAEVSQDQFDDWSNNRDQMLLSSRSYQYVSPDVYGADDLDSYGSWVPSSYGNVWAPRVEAGWAPYHNGRWVWEDYYGWTWVDYAPWGWAPFHYGRWFLNGSAGWCWWPGAIRQSYFWHPAVVGFFGFGAGGFGFNIGFQFGNVGWVPLAPYEPWHAWYGRGLYGGYGNRTVINNTIVNNTNIYNVYRNARVNNGIAYTNANGFGQGRQAFYGASGAQIQNASLVRGQLPLAPSRSSLAFSNNGTAFQSQRFASVQNRQFFSRQQPPQVQRVPFAEQQQKVAQFQERTLGVRPNLNNEGARPNTFAQGGARPTYNQSGAGYANVPRPGNSQANNGWQRFGQGPQGATSSNAYNNSRQAAGIRPSPGAGMSAGGQGRPQSGPSSYGSASSPQNESGWHRFGDPGAGNFSRSYQRPLAAPSTGNQADGWHRFGSPRDSYQPSAPANRPAYNAPSSNYGQYRNEQSSGYRPQQPMRMNQPIVNDRLSYQSPSRAAEPRYSAPQSSYQAPRAAEPRYSAPRPSAPSGGGGHESGGARSGGGGGSHSGGGNSGGGHHR